MWPLSIIRWLSLNSHFLKVFFSRFLAYVFGIVSLLSRGSAVHNRTLCTLAGIWGSVSHVLQFIYHHKSCHLWAVRNVLMAELGSNVASQTDTCKLKLYTWPTQTKYQIKPSFGLLSWPIVLGGCEQAPTQYHSHMITFYCWVCSVTWQVLISLSYWNRHCLHLIVSRHVARNSCYFVIISKFLFLLVIRVRSPSLWSEDPTPLTLLFDWTLSRRVVSCFLASQWSPFALGTSVYSLLLIV